jgi:hypothetical protein
MKLLYLRLLRGPNVHAMQSCCAGMLELEDGDVIDAAGPLARRSSPSNVPRLAQH